MIQPRNIKLAVFDLDGTITKPTSSWEHIHRQLGTWENGGEIYLKKFLAGEISYEDFARLDSSHWQGINFTKIRDIAKKVKYNPGVKEIMDYLRESKIQVVIISGGLSVISDKVVEDFDIEDVYINDLIVDGGLLTGEVKINVSYNGKLAIYKKLLKQYDLKPSQVMTVGDTPGDIPLFKNSGLAVAINPITSDVAEIADITVKSLAEVIPLIKGNGSRVGGRGNNVRSENCARCEKKL